MSQVIFNMDEHFGETFFVLPEFRRTKLLRAHRPGVGVGAIEIESRFRVEFWGVSDYRSSRNTGKNKLDR